MAKPTLRVVETIVEWRPMESAPKNGTPIILLTHDFGAVEGRWNKDIENFYKSQKGWASYDPDNMMGDWVSHWQDDDPRLYCGATPIAWIPKPEEPLRDDYGRWLGKL